MLGASGHRGVMMGANEPEKAHDDGKDVPNQPRPPFSGVNEDALRRAFGGDL